MSLQASFGPIGPNTIIQDNLPLGEPTAPQNVDLWSWSSYYGWHAAPMESEKNFDAYYAWYVMFDFDKYDGFPGSPDDFWIANATGSAYDDVISGIGLLTDIEFSTSPNGTIAQADPSIYLGDLVFFNIDGGAGDDNVTGANNADMLMGGLGDDYVNGLAGDDSILGGDGNDYLVGGDDDDLIDGGDGDDVAYGGNGDDNVVGGTGYDVLSGDYGNDNLYGGDQGDGLGGGDGDDYISGGSGNDEMAGGSGNDGLDGGSGDDYIAGDSGDDIVLGGTGMDAIYGGNGNDQLAGEDDDDNVYGDSGDDMIDGGTGDDDLYGGDGADVISGGASGDDILTGGAGKDVFIFCDNDVGQDVIEDFSTGQVRDQIDLTMLLALDRVVVEATGELNTARLDLYDGAVWLGEIFIKSAQMASVVFDKDSTFGTGDGAIVQLGGGVVVDLPSMSVLYNDGGGLFF